MHASVDEVRSFEVYGLGVGLDDVGGEIARDVEHTLVVFDGVLEVDGCILVLVLVCEVALLEFNDSLHLRMTQIEVILGVVCIVICHFFTYCSACNT